MTKVIIEMKWIIYTDIRNVIEVDDWIDGLNDQEEGNCTLVELTDGMHLLFRNDADATAFKLKFSIL